MAAYRIIAFDGGGILGLLTGVLLRRLIQERPAALDHVDLFAGTSTGGIIALSIASGVPVDTIIALYRDKGPSIFDDTWLDDLRDLGGLTGADYDNRNLKKELTRVFDKATLKDLNRRVLVPAFDLDNLDRAPEPGEIRHWKPKFFHNFPGSDSDGAESVVDVALRTSAAPTYFPSYDGHIDGGVVANNPSLAAVAQAIDPRAGKQRLEDIHVLSIGTGRNPAYIKGKSHDWGYAGWGKQLIRIMIEGVMGVAEFQCRQLLGDRFHRLDPWLPQDIPLDCVKKIPEIAAIAQTVNLAPTIDWMKKCGY